MRKVGFWNATYFFLFFFNFLHFLYIFYIFLYIFYHFLYIFYTFFNIFRSENLIQTYCGNPYAYNLFPNITEIFSDNFNYGYTNFDNLQESLFTVFQSVTGEGWSSILYMVFIFLKTSSFSR